VQPPESSWGNMLSQASGLLGTPAMHLLIFPGVFILVTVLAVNFIGDGLRDAFDPHAKH
jgi:peptide/nickel transport system permease protein